MKRKYSMDALFALILYGMFTLVSLLLVLIGAQIYRGIVQRTEDRSNVRASLSYVANKVRSSPEASLENREGTAVLVLSEQQEGQRIETLIYCYEGKLRELYQLEGKAFIPENGEELAAVSGFSIAQPAEDLLMVTSKDAGGREHTLHIQKRAG
ncbi:MAG: DUF4860 domain-containing protein [Clostridiales bacterium]|nr:DUF4860 domain-containing protein [Clostridiales bacterium]